MGRPEKVPTSSAAQVQMVKSAGVRSRLARRHPRPERSGSSAWAKTDSSAPAPTADRNSTRRRSNPDCFTRTRTTPALSTCQPVGSGRPATRPSRSITRFKAWTAGVGSLMAGDSARLAVSTSCRRPKPGSCSKVRSLPKRRCCCSSASAKRLDSAPCTSATITPGSTCSPTATCRSTQQLRRAAAAANPLTSMHCSTRGVP